jgi:hypothetical protein
MTIVFIVLTIACAGIIVLLLFNNGKQEKLLAQKDGEVAAANQRAENARLQNETQEKINKSRADFEAEAARVKGEAIAAQNKAYVSTIEAQN